MFSQQLILGSVYRLKFKGPFERHGVCTTSGLTCLHKGNGTFKLEAITTFRSLVLSGVKLYDNFFMPVGITEADYRQYYNDKPADEYSPEYTIKTIDDVQTVDSTRINDSGKAETVKKTIVQTKEVWTETGNSILAKHVADAVEYSKYPIYKFIDVVDTDDVIYVPALTLDGFPEIELSEYKNLSLVLHLGYFDDPTKLDPMLLAIRERMCIYGVKPRNIKLYSTGSKYLNPDEYEQIKSIRLPSNIQTIDKDALLSDYENQRVIINDNVKYIVGKVTEGSENQQIAFDSIKSKNTVIDRMTFEQTVTPLEIFNGNSSYYEIMQDGGYRLLPETEALVGDEVMIMEEFTYTSGSLKSWEKVYSASQSVYCPMSYNASRVSGLYVKNTTTTDGTVEVTYTKATATQLADTSLVLYKKITGGYEEVDAPIAGTKYYKSKPRSANGTGNYVSECYVTQQALSLLGTTFTWVDNTSASRYITGLTHADIIDIASRSQLSGITLVYKNDSLTAESVKRRFEKWVGRIFRVKDAVLGTTIDYTVPAVPDEKFRDLSGDIIGQDGLVSREINFLDEDVVDRNYYLRYMEQVKEFNRLKERCAFLEEVVKDLKSKE